MELSNKKAFSLPEMLMAMLIIAIASLAMLPILTKPKPQIDTVGVRGQFACYYDKNGNLVQEEYQERSRKEVKNAGKACELEFNQRPRGYLIIALGAGSNNAPGQVKTEYVSYFGDALEIKVAKAYSHDATTVGHKNGGQLEVSAGPGAAINNNGLVGSNIKSCKLLTAGENCGSGGDENSIQVDCKSNYPIADDVVIYCKDKDSNNNSKGYSIPVRELTKPEGTFSTFTYGNGTYKLNLELEDSMYTLKKYQQGRPNGDSKSAIELILDKIHPQRKTELINKFIEQKYGDNSNNNNKDGAVLILW